MWRLLVLCSVAWGQDLLFAAEVSRHGARAPNRIFDFQKDYWKDYVPGQLTALGMRQAFLVGCEWRRRLIEDLGFLNATYHPSELWVQSTNSDRALETAQCQLAGLYPIRTGPKLPRGRILRPPVPVRDVESIERELGDSALPFLLQPVAIHTESTENDHVLHGYKTKVCPRVRQIREILTHSVEYMAIERKAESLIRDLSCLLEGGGLQAVKQLYSALNCDINQGNPIPAGIDLDLLREIHDDLVLLPFRDPEVQVLVCSEFFKQLFGQLEDRLEGGKLRFAMYSAHDYTLLAFMSCMGAQLDIAPPFASILMIELYSDKTIKVTYNELPLLSKACPAGSCSFDSFHSFMQKFIVDDIEKACEASSLEHS